MTDDALRRYIDLLEYETDVEDEIDDDQDIDEELDLGDPDDVIAAIYSQLKLNKQEASQATRAIVGAVYDELIDVFSNISIEEFDHEINSLYADIGVSDIELNEDRKRTLSESLIRRILGLHINRKTFWNNMSLRVERTLSISSMLGWSGGLMTSTAMGVMLAADVIVAFNEKEFENWIYLVAEFFVNYGTDAKFLSSLISVVISIILMILHRNMNRRIIARRDLISKLSGAKEKAQEDVEKIFDTLDRHVTAAQRKKGPRKTAKKRKTPAKKKAPPRKRTQRRPVGR